MVEKEVVLIFYAAAFWLFDVTHFSRGKYKKIELIFLYR